MTITVPVFGATEEANVEPAVSGMRVILAQDAELYDHNPAAMEEAGDGPGTIKAVLADRPESPLLVEWPSGARSFHRAAALVALGWPVPPAEVDADWDADGGISIGRTIGANFHSMGFTAEQATRIHAQLGELLGLPKPALEVLPMPEEVTEEDDYFTLGQELASIADRELRVAVAFLRGLNTMQLDALQTTVATAPQVNLGPSAKPPVFDGRSNRLTVGARVHRLTNNGGEGTQVGTVVAFLPDGVSVRWGAKTNGPLVVSPPRKLVVI